MDPNTRLLGEHQLEQVRGNLRYVLGNQNLRWSAIQDGLEVYQRQEELLFESFAKPGQLLDYKVLVWVGRYNHLRWTRAVWTLGIFSARAIAALLPRARSSAGLTLRRVGQSEDRQRLCGGAGRRSALVRAAQRGPLVQRINGNCDIGSR